MADAIALYTQIIICAIPYGVAFAVCQLLVDSFMSMAFGGKVKFN